MTAVDEGDSVPQMRRDRWPTEPGERVPAEERSKLVGGIERGMRQLVAAWRSPDEWTAPELLALKLVRRITLAFLMGPPGTALEKTRREALALFDAEPLEKKRIGRSARSLVAARIGALMMPMRATSRSFGLCANLK
jgi:hypothetical protein